MRSSWPRAHRSRVARKQRNQDMRGHVTKYQVWASPYCYYGICSTTMSYSLKFSIGTVYSSSFASNRSLQHARRVKIHGTHATPANNPSNPAVPSVPVHVITLSVPSSKSPTRPGNVSFLPPFWHVFRTSTWFWEFCDFSAQNMT